MDILVYAHWKELETPTLMGVLSVTHTRGHAVFTFSYDEQWIRANKAQNLDPDLQLYDGPQLTTDLQLLPGRVYGSWNSPVFN
jgi:serine/threonine-protein kinase HipA